MYRIAVVGDRDTVLCFRTLGLEGVEAETADEARRALHRMAKESYAIVYVTEQLAAGMGDALERYHDALTPAVILIPGRGGSLGIGSANVRTAVEKAVGADIL